MNGKHKIIKASFVLVILLLVGLGVKAQQWKQDIKRLQSTYNSKVSYRAEMTQRIYYDGVMSYEVDSRIAYSGGKFHSKIDQYEIISDTKHTVTIDHTNKSVILSNSISNQSNSLNFDSAIANVDKVTTSLKGSRKIHRFEFKDGNSQWMEMEFDSSSNILKRIRYRSRYLHEDDDGKFRQVETEILYKSISINPVFATDEFKTSRVVVHNSSKGTWSLSQQYANFELTNILTADLK